MNPSQLHSGAVFQTPWNDRPIRIIAFDERQVMYDSWWPHLPGWGINSLSRTVSYFRLPTALLFSKAEYVRTEEYSDAELLVHRPDLPFAFASTTRLEWPTNAPDTAEEFPGNAFQFPADGSCEPQTLDTPKIYLGPFGPKGSCRPGILLEAENGRFFTVEEILWQAAKLQAQFLRDVKATAGVGIYRSGIQRKLPSYYVWGSKSRMEV
jgi:hypothetical protein